MISYEDFYIQAINLCEKSHKKWRWIEPPRNENGQLIFNLINNDKSSGYLYRESVISLNESYLLVQYFITYSKTFSMPVLYFDALLNNNRSSLDDLYKYYLYKIYRPSAGVKLIITIETHPILLLPYFYLHCCQIHEILDNILFKDNSHQFKNMKSDCFYLELWLSIINPFFS